MKMHTDRERKHIALVGKIGVEDNVKGWFESTNRNDHQMKGIMVRDAVPTEGGASCL